MATEKSSHDDSTHLPQGVYPHIALWDDPEYPSGFEVGGSPDAVEYPALYHAFERRGNTARYLRDLKRLLLPSIEVCEIDSADLDSFLRDAL